MALFKINKGQKANLPKTYVEGYCYFTTDDGKFYIDTTNTAAGRILLNAGKADTLTTTLPINKGGTEAASASDARYNLLNLGTNVISTPAEDTISNWGKFKGIGVSMYSTLDQLNGQPTQYGILLNLCGNVSEVHQLWFTQSSGTVYHRGGNANGWSDSTWRAFLDSINYSSYTVKKDGTGASGTWGINISGNAATATNVAWSGITSKPSYYDAKAIKSITRSGITFTYTCLDGTTGTFTQQDNNTTYSAGTGISLSGTTFSYDPGNMSGGYNYCFDTDTGTHWGWSHQSGGTTVSTGTSHGCKTAIIQRDETEASGWAYLYYNAVDLSKLEDGKEYYWCFDVYSSLDCSINLTGIMNGNGTNNIANISAIRNSIPAKTWTTCIYKLTINIGTTPMSSQLMYMSVSRKDPGMQLIFKNPRLVRGNMGSGYTNIESKYTYLNNNNFTTYITPAAIGAATASHTHNAILYSNTTNWYVTPAFADATFGGVQIVGNGATLGYIYIKNNNLYTFNGSGLSQTRYHNENNLSFSLSGTTLTIIKS